MSANDGTLAKTKHDTTHNRLKAVDLPRFKPGMYHDGGGLWLQVRGGSRSWLFRYSRDKQAKVMGLGPLHTISLADARQRARDARRLLVDGLDPLEARATQRASKRLAMTFQQAAEALIAAKEIGWKNPKHRKQWPATLTTYAYPLIGDLSVDSIDTGHVTRVLEPIWATKPETASRLRGRIESVLDWAAARGYRSGENPARWKGHLENLLPAVTKTKRAARQARNRGDHFDALSYKDLPEFIAKLRDQGGTAARALEFTILTAARTVEVIGARWQEFDLANRVWTVPSDRMKAGKEHRVPLSDRAMAILGVPGAPDEFVFPGLRAGKPLSNMAMLKVLQRMGLRTPSGGLTVHGFRSTFMDWATECTNFPSEMRDLALAHTVSDKVEAAYRRGDMFERRREMMAAWERFCEPESASEKIVPLRGMMR